MTKEEAIKYLQQLYPYGGYCWLDEQRIEAIDMAIKALQEEPSSSVWHEPIELPDSNKVVLIIVRLGYIGEPGIPYLAKYDNVTNQYILKDRTDVCNRPILYSAESVEKWIYVEDILNLAHSEATKIKVQEEPVSEDLEKEMQHYFCKEWAGDPVAAARHFAEWQKEQMMHWKPTEEQMEALDTAVILGNLSFKDMDILSTLRRDLKAL